MCKFMMALQITREWRVKVLFCKATRNRLIHAHRYAEKLELINGKDPYELPKQAWKNDVDLWPCITYINVGMYLVFSPSTYTGEALMNYKSLECYQRFLAGWVREILVLAEGERRILTAKVLLDVAW